MVAESIFAFERSVDAARFEDNDLTTIANQTTTTRRPADVRHTHRGTREVRDVHRCSPRLREKAKLAAGCATDVNKQWSRRHYSDQGHHPSLRTSDISSLVPSPRTLNLEEV